MPTRRRIVTVRDPWVPKNSRLPLHPGPPCVLTAGMPEYGGGPSGCFASIRPRTEDVRVPPPPFSLINAPRVAPPAFRLERCFWPDRVFSPINAGRNRRKNRLILRRFYGLNALTVLLAFSRNAGRFLS